MYLKLRSGQTVEVADDFQLSVFVALQLHRPRTLIEVMFEGGKIFIPVRLLDLRGEAMSEMVIKFLRRSGPATSGEADNFALGY